MPAASILSSVTDALTELIGDHGIYAVFVLMFVDAVLPAASELVMVYAGAVAAGAFAGQSVVLFGEPIESELWAYVAMASAGASATSSARSPAGRSVTTADGRSSSGAGAGCTSRRTLCIGPRRGSTASATGRSRSAA